MAQQLSWVPGGMAVDLQTHTAAVKLQRASAEHSGHPHDQSQMEMSKFAKNHLQFVTF